jgi:hypothetical protein
MSTSHLLDDPQHWRMRAEEVRTMADGMRDADSKRILHNIAADYDRLASWADTRLKAMLEPRP